MESTVNAYARFGAVVTTSTVVMLLLMYLNTDSPDHIHFSDTRAFMALSMGAAMALVLLCFMGHLLKSRTANAVIAAGSVLVLSASLWLVRSLATVDQVSYLKAMIPHHSTAVLNSERARISDPRVRRLADGIIASRKQEMVEMERLLDDLSADR